MSNKRSMMGIVTSDKMDKTVIVTVESTFMHSLYKKTVKRRKKYMAQDTNNECKIGDKVKIIESRPLSAKKRWKVIEIVERAQ